MDNDELNAAIEASNKMLDRIIIGLAITCVLCLIALLYVSFS